MATVTSDQMASLRRPGMRFQHPPSFLAALVLRLVCAGLVIWVAVVHLHLWSEGYRDIPTVGPLFLANAVTGFLLAAVLLLWPRPLAGLLGAGFMASALGGLIVSLNFGLFGFRESSGASFVTETIILESVGAVALLTWSVAVWNGWTRSRFSGRETPTGLALPPPRGRRGLPSLAGGREDIVSGLRRGRRRRRGRMLLRRWRDRRHLLRGQGIVLPTDLAILIKTVIECEATTEQLDPTLSMLDLVGELGTSHPRPEHDLE